MKKIIFYLIAGVLLVSITACATTDGKEERHSHTY